MKNLKSLRTYLVVVMALGLSVSITSCGDDASAPEIVSAKDVEGNYSGKMKVTSLPQAQPHEATEEPVGADVTAIVEATEVVFAKFPVKDIIESIVPAEQVDAFVKAIGDVTYKLPYTAALNKEYTQINLSFAPKPLELEFTVPIIPVSNSGVREGEEVAPKMKVVVTFSAKDAGVFTYEGKTLKFAMNLDKVTVDGEEVLPAALNLSFDLVR